MSTITIGWLNKCRCGNKSHTVKTARGNETALWDDDTVKCNSCGRGGVIQVCEGQARVLWETDEEMAENKPMSTITKERVKDILEFGAGRIISPITDDEIMELARIAQASLEAEPVGEVVLGEFDDCGCHPDARVVCIAADGQADWANFKDGTRLYTAPPAPVSVPDAIEPTVEAIKLVLPTSNPDEYAACIGANMWNACRAAMLQGAENAWSPTTMKTAPAMGSSPKIAEATSGNSPVIPDGWVACSERMPDNRGKSRELYVCWGTYFDGAEPDYIPALFFIHPTNGWCEWEPLEDDCDPKKVVITHWMPMPAAPLQEAE